MLDIKRLERRWLKYKIKSFFPYFIALFVILSMLIGTSLWFNAEDSEDHNRTDSQKTVVSPTAVPLPPMSDHNKTVLEPSMEFVQAFQNQPAASEPETKMPSAALPIPAVNKPAPPIPTPPRTLHMPEYTPPPVVPAVSRSVTNDKSLSINRNESKLDIEDLQRRFKETSNANLGLFIARYYYDHGDYNEAYNYALKTNNVNNRIDESWILFSKSLVKLGKTDQAKKTLQLYISQSNSDAARGLLDAIEKGNFK
ncbi:tetratricopeptide repeat protein [Sulfuricurvum sp.]|uniref:tetratricopeptide repeat protein n=1 Tax=Sulfuricurvum sp. TaxID=2025608 RepID=UPI003C554692